jgi:hypothetical protein
MGRITCNVRCPHCLAWIKIRTYNPICVTDSCHWCFQSVRVIFDPAKCLLCKDCFNDYKIVVYEFEIEAD